MKTNFNTDEIKVVLHRLMFAVTTFIKWLACSVVCGVILGLIGTFFYKLLGLVTVFRETNPWILFGLPVAGLLIVLCYRLAGETRNTGTNLVITAIQSNDEVPVHVAPLIILSTLLTHLCGGSAGREGAALQVGGSIGNFFAKLLHFDDKDTRINDYVRHERLFFRSVWHTDCRRRLFNGSHQCRRDVLRSACTMCGICTHGAEHCKIFRHCWNTFCTR